MRGISSIAIGIAMLATIAASAQEQGADPLMSRAQAMFKPIPEQPPKLDDNPRNPAKVELGRLLYFEPRLSRGQLTSCNTCHQLGMGGDDGQETARGHQARKGPRNSPTVLNAVFNLAQFWDGRAKDLEAQAEGPLQASVEMAGSPDYVVEVLSSMPEYRQLFAEAFPEQDSPVTFDNATKAIEAFESTLLTPNAPFDQYLRGDAGALTAEQKRGLKLFMDKGCAGCHNGVNLGGASYQRFGVVEQPGAEILPADDKGRFAVTQSASDEYVFKVPSLRNIELTRPYFHSGKSWSLEQAVAVMGSTQLGQTLNEAEVDKIVAFMKSLTGEQPLVEIPVLPPDTAETPRPAFPQVSGSSDH